MKSKYIAIIILFIIACIAVGLYYKQNKPRNNTGVNDPYWANKNIPADIRSKADGYIIAKVGQDFFDKYVTLDTRYTAFHEPDKSCNKYPGVTCADFLTKPYYTIQYTAKITENPDITWPMLLNMDGQGNLASERDLEGVPDCVQNAQLCKFAITKQQAIDIAKNAGLQKGMNPSWGIQLQTPNKNVNYFTWEITNMLHADQDSITGKAVDINANTGKLIDIRDWGAIP